MKTFISLFHKNLWNFILGRKENIKDIAGHLEITHPGPDTENSKPKTIFPKSPVTINFDLEVANKLQPNANSDQLDNLISKFGENNDEPETPAAEEELNFPEIVDPTKKITKSKAKKSKNKSKIPQKQNSKEKKEVKPKNEVDVEWDFEDQKSGKASKQKNDVEGSFTSRKAEEEFLKAEAKIVEDERIKDFDTASGRRKGQPPNYFLISFFFFVIKKEMSLKLLNVF